VGPWAARQSGRESISTLARSGAALDLRAAGEARAPLAGPQLPGGANERASGAAPRNTGAESGQAGS